MIGGASARGRRSGGCCSHSHRITALVLTMSVIFLVGITIAVFLLESKLKIYFGDQKKLVCKCCRKISHKITFIVH